MAKQLIYEKENWFQSCLILFKNWPCVTSCPLWRHYDSVIFVHSQKYICLFYFHHFWFKISKYFLATDFLRHIFLVIAVCQLHWFPWLSLTICFYQPLILESLLNDIKYLHWADEYDFFLICQHWYVHEGLHRRKSLMSLPLLLQLQVSLTHLIG